MINRQRFAKTIAISVAIFILSFTCFSSFGQANGQALFSSNCASCHAVHKDLTGPALAGVEERWGDKEKLHSWIKNSLAVVKTGDAYAVSIYEKWNRINMPAFNLSNEEIDAILAYVKSVPDPKAAAAATPAGGTQAAGAPTQDDNTLLYGILTLVLAIIVLILLQVNSNLRKLSAEKQGEPVLEPVPFWRNKVYIALFTIVLFCIGGYMTVTGAINLGRSKDYQPEQPIYYSHKVHAGTNQISCLYCHGGAQEGKHANIPSVNICMNCHMAVTEYTGTDKLYKEDGTEVDGTAEIQRLFKYAGYEPGKPWDPSKAKPVEWVKIHNLPDHVYFNHSQHVTAGKVACQTCHGEIQKMDEVKQFTDLSMGWCVNCHRETKVQFQENGFYSIYEKFHEDLKSGRIDSAKGITVEKIGGTECQKCHY